MPEPVTKIFKGICTGGNLGVAGLGVGELLSSIYCCIRSLVLNPTCFVLPHLRPEEIYDYDQLNLRATCPKVFFECFACIDEFRALHSFVYCCQTAGGGCGIGVGLGWGTGAAFGAQYIDVGNADFQKSNVRKPNVFQAVQYEVRKLVMGNPKPAPTTHH